MDSEATALAAPQYLRISPSPAIPLDGRHGLTGITFSAGVLAEIRRFAVEEHAEDREAAGVLLGQRVDSTLQVTSFQPIWRSEFSVKHFALNESEERQWRKQLAKWKIAKGGGIEAVGWFRAHGRGEAFLDEADLQLHSRFFTAPWALAMGIRPAHQKLSTATIYMRDAEGSWQTRQPLQHLMLPGDAYDQHRSQVRRPAVHLVRGFRAWTRVFMPLRQWALYALSLVLLSLSLIAFLQARSQSEITGMQLSARLQQDRLTIRWNKNAVSRSARSSAYLMLGGERRNLSEEEFNRGQLDLPLLPQDLRDLEVRLYAGAYEDSTHVLRALR